MPALTSIRAMFAWWVVALHFAPLTPFSADQHTPLIYKGVTMVDCFFVLSGIVMWFAYRTLMQRASWPDVRAFWVARFGRVYPPHITMLAALAGLVWAMWLTVGVWPSATPQFTWETFVQSALLLNGSVVGYVIAWNQPSWSISSEAFAYMLAPAVFWVLHRTGPKTALGLIACLLAALIIPNEVWPQYMLPPMVRVLNGFVLGAALSRCRPWAEPIMLQWRTPALVLGWGAAAGLAGTSHTGLFIAALVGVMAFLGLRTAPAQGMWWRRLERVTLYLGETSFAIYASHWIVVMLWAGWASRMSLGPFAHPILAAALIAIIVQGLASLLHHTIAEPARRMIRGQARVAQPIATEAVKVTIRSAAYWLGWEACARGRPLWELEAAARAGWMDRAAVEGRKEGWQVL